MISIIIPCYNSEKTIKKCVFSILNQTYQDFEIILVNDHSKDDTLSLLIAFKEQWPNKVVVLNKEKNEGVDFARFDGIKEAKGNFITFLDADDWLELRTLEVMYLAMQEDNYDYVEVGMNRVIGKHGWIKRKFIQRVVGEISQPELFEKYYISFFGVNILSVNMCGKLYRKSFLDSVPLKPSQLAMGEDLYFNLMLFPYLKKIKIIDYIGYNYRFGGMTTKYNPYLFPSLEKLYSIKLELAKKHNYSKAIPYLLIELKNVFKSDVKQRILHANEARNEVIKYMKGLFTFPHFLKDVYDYYKNIDKAESNDFVVALRKMDFEKMYQLCYSEVKKEKKIRFIKRCLNFISRYI